MLTHAHSTYPHECCGVLLGQLEPLRAVEAYPGRNIQEATQSSRRYTLDPADIVAADRRAEALGLEIAGFYHSHPNAPAIPSAEDCRLAWPGYLYLILATSAQGVGDMRAWVFLPAGTPPQELALELAPGTAPRQGQQRSGI